MEKYVNCLKNWVPPEKVNNNVIYMVSDWNETKNLDLKNLGVYFCLVMFA